MVCIYCGSKTQVANSRHQKRVNQVWRRRECTRCHAVFTSLEAADYASSIVVRPTEPTEDPHSRSKAAAGAMSAKDRRTAIRASKHTPPRPFNRDQLFASLLKCLGHRSTPVEDASALTSTVIAKLLAQGSKASISPAEIIIVATDTLKRFDKAAMVQYQAYHPR